MWWIAFHVAPPLASVDFFAVWLFQYSSFSILPLSGNTLVGWSLLEGQASVSNLPEAAWEVCYQAGHSSLLASPRVRGWSTGWTSQDHEDYHLCLGQIENSGLRSEWQESKISRGAFTGQGETIYTSYSQEHVKGFFPEPGIWQSTEENASEFDVCWATLIDVRKETKSKCLFCLIIINYYC